MKPARECLREPVSFCLFSSDHRIVEPFLANKSLCENDGSHAPVREHPNPGCHDPHMHHIAKEDRQCHPEEPHGQTGYDHGKFHIACRSQPIGEYKGWHPEDRLYNRDQEHHMQKLFHTLRRHTGKDRCGSCRQIHRQTTDDQRDLRNECEFFT